MSPSFLSIPKEEADEPWCDWSALKSQRGGTENPSQITLNLKEYGILNKQP